MGDNIGSGSVTGCCLWSLGNILSYREKQNKQNPNRCHHLLITQLTLDSRNSTIAKILFESKDLMVAVKPRNLFIDFLCSVAPKAVLQPEPGVLGDPCLMGMKSFQFHQSWFDVWPELIVSKHSKVRVVYLFCF